MKQDIHPQYYAKSKIKCVCGKTFEFGATKPEIQVEIGSNCHPFYTGKEKLLDIAGRVERFKMRAAKKAKAVRKKSEKKAVKKAKKNKIELAAKKP